MIRPISITEFEHIDKVVGRLSRIDTPEYQAIANLREGEGIKIPHSAAFPCAKTYHKGIRKGHCALTTLVYNIARMTGGKYRTNHLGPRDIENSGQTCDHMSKGRRSGKEVVAKQGHNPEDCGSLAVFRYTDDTEQERI